MKNSIKYFETYVSLLRDGELYPKIHEVTGRSSNPHIQIKGKEYINFSSNNYLSLASNKIAEKEMIDAVREYGIGSGSTRLLSGTLDVQVNFEKELAEYLGYEDSITFSSGFLANVGVIRMLVDPFPYFSLIPESQGVIISDELNHASIVDGVRLAKSERAIYKHNDMEALEDQLQVHKEKRKLIITDGVFSMDGEIANLVEITKLARKYDAVLMVDDSHGVGVLGPQGMGAARYVGADDGVDVLMGSFTKGFGSIGGFIAASSEICEYLRVTARSYIFSDPIIPSVVASLRKTLEIIKNGDELRKSVLDNAHYLRTELRKQGFTVLGDITPIVPLLISDEDLAIKFSTMLHEHGILAPCIRQPAVTPGKERIRLSVMTDHSKKDIDTLLSATKKIGEKLKMI